MSQEQKEDFKKESVIYVNPLPLAFGREDEYLPTDGRGCLFLSLILIIFIILLISIVYVVISR